MGRADLVPFLGTTFIDWFPVVILIPALFALLGSPGRCSNFCGIKNPYDDDSIEGENDLHASNEAATDISADIADGKALINEGKRSLFPYLVANSMLNSLLLERAMIERAINPNIGIHRGLIDRARSALGVINNSH